MAFYLVLFFIGIGFLALTTLLGSLFDAGDHGGDLGQGDSGAEASGGLDGPHLPSPFSPRTMAGAATGFGAGGGLALLNGVEGNASLFFALLGSLLVGGASYGFLVWLVNQQRSSHVIMGDLVGESGTVVTDIGPSGLGQIVVLARGQTGTYLARSATGAALPRGSQVEIEALAGDALLVRPAGGASIGH